MSTNNTKLKMIETALDLFHQKGVNATGINEILKKSNTGKGQFTYYFKDKNGLIRSVLNFLIDIIKSGEAATGYELNTWKDLNVWFQNYISFQGSVNFTKSCPIGTIGNDLNEKQEVIRQDVQLFFEWSRNKLARFFAERKAAGELDKSACPDGLADLCISVMQGGMLVTKIRRNPDIFENSAKEVLAYIRLLKVEKM